MSLAQLSLAVPIAEREQFLARATLLAQRARESGATRLEYRLALAVLLALCGGSATPGWSETS